MSQLQKISCEVEFITPAFLGNATQRGQWRVPPFKSLLRRWWRILKAEEYDYDWRRLREEEGLLWGNAFLERPHLSGRKNGHQQALIKLRLGDWRMGDLDNNGWKQFRFGKQKATSSAQYAIDVDVYLGFGAVLPPSKKQGRKFKELAHAPAIADGEQTVLQLLLQDENHSALAREILGLVHHFGSLGSRANNGWGSVQCRIGNTPPPLPQIPARDWQACLELDWPHAFGKDAKGYLIWASAPVNDWIGALKQIACAKADVRDIAKKLKAFRNHKPTAVFLLGYPVQGPHELDNAKELRWPSPLRFKVQALDNGAFRALAYHLPHRPPPAMWELFDSQKRRWVEETQVELWDGIHAYFDKDSEWSRWEGR